MRSSSNCCRMLWPIGTTKRPDYIEYYVMELTLMVRSRSSTMLQYASCVAQSTSAKTSYTDLVLSRRLLLSCLH